MREILFRGKRLDNGEWCEGYPVPYGGKVVIFANPQDLGDERVGWDTHAIDPSSIGQFTGLCDRNGKRIFEGDIVSFDGCAGEPHEEPVRYHASVFAEWEPFDYCPSNKCEVIGTIHDAKEGCK